MELGTLTGQVISILQTAIDFFDDPITVHYGVGLECGGHVCRAAERKALAAVQAAGFPTYQAFIDEVTARTSARWVWNSSLLMGDAS